MAKAVLITGASAGIGYALASEFFAHGHNVILVARNAQRLEDAACELRAQRATETGPTVATVTMDVFEPDAPQALSAYLSDASIELEALVLNAASWSQGEVSEIATDEARRVVYANIAATCELAHALVPRMIERRTGNILVVGSLAGEVPAPTNAVYSASKAFLRNWTLSLREELAPHAVNVSLLLPGVVATDFANQVVTDRDIGETRDTAGARLLFAGTPRSVAWCGYRGLMSGQDIIVPGLFYGGVYFGLRLLPARFATRIRRYVSRQAGTDAA